MEAAYMAASGNDTLPAMARQIYYQARPKIMAMTDDKELAYGYFSQDSAARLHRGARRRLECRLRRARSFRRAAHQPAYRLRDHRGRQLSARDAGAGDRPGEVCRRQRRHHRAIWQHCRVLVLREGGVRPAVQGGESRRPLRPDDHLDQGRLGHRREAVDRRHLRRPRYSALRAARLRCGRVPDPGNAATRHPTLSIFKH